ncbi:MAG: T9SS type A sorting domain-containing protein [Bacteroidales bacterium]|nr:T9SS type A sorting domain-containing protein [Bacteroidales bacterium]
MKCNFVILLLLFTLLRAQDPKVNTIKHDSVPVTHMKGNALYESFESFPFPPTGWKLISSGNPRTWDTASLDPFEGNFYVHCLYDESLSSTQNEYLITPVMDLTQFSSAILRFYFQFSKYWGIYPKNNYDLYVVVSTDSGKTFTDTLWNETMTDTSKWESFEWVKVELSLSAYLSQSKVALAFVYHGFDGAEASLDAIQIETAGGIDVSTSSFSIFPNPAQDYITINQTSSMSELLIIDMSGKIILRSNITPSQKINISHLPKGLYIMQINSPQGNSRVKLIKL